MSKVCLMRHRVTQDCRDKELKGCIKVMVELDCSASSRADLFMSICFQKSKISPLMWASQYREVNLVERTQEYG